MHPKHYQRRIAAENPGALPTRDPPELWIPAFRHYVELGAIWFDHWAGKSILYALQGNPADEKHV